MIMSVMPFATVASSNINTPQGWQHAFSAHCNHALQDLTQFTVIYCGVTHCCILIFDWFICHISSCKSPRSWQLSYIILDNCVRYIPSCLTMIWDHKHVFFCTGCAFAVYLFIYLPHLFTPFSTSKWGMWHVLSFRFLLLFSPDLQIEHL